MRHQTTFAKIKERRDIRFTMMLNHTEMQTVKDGMERMGESNASNFIRRLIQDERLRANRK